ncbi:MAG: hypothetical protein JXQ30_09490 [Spirochaetes bacterium]|nr:hypothetical protein [Spirochaetota bacterium]
MKSRLYRLLAGIVACTVIVYIAVRFVELVSLKRMLAERKEMIEELLLKMPDEDLLLEKIERLRHANDTQRGMFYRHEEMDANMFGILIQDLLIDKEIDIERFRTVGKSGTDCLEFSVSGLGSSFVEFVHTVSTNDKYLRIPYLKITADDEEGIIKAVFRITYETGD